MEANGEPRFRLLDLVSLVEDDLGHKVKSSYIGTIVDILNDGEAYTVEFIDEKGNTVEEALLKEYKAGELKRL